MTASGHGALGGYAGEAGAEKISRMEGVRGSNIATELYIQPTLHQGWQ